MDASKIILGFTGSLGSGCSFIAKAIPTVSEKQYKYYKLSDIIRDILKTEGIDNPSVSEMQDKGNTLRKEHGNGYLIKALVEKIKSEKLDNDTEIIIDGIKNSGEVKTLRQFPYFFLFSIHSDSEHRKNRYKEASIITDDDMFMGIDNRDRLEEFSHGQQVKTCNYLSDIIILNDNNFLPADRKGKRDYIQGIYSKYVKLVELLKSGEHSAEHAPSVNEFCMTTAYAVSRMSSCLKRKVGAVIVDKMEAKHNNGKTGVVDSQPFIVSTGYNEVPLGSSKCIFNSGVEMCYRDYLQEQHAEKINRCPNCGKKINVPKVSCPICGKMYHKFKKYCKICQVEIEDSFKCECGTKVFKDFLPGEKNTPGKLLDMCRALHAEENALLNLIKNNNSQPEKLTFYVTTQPCNLCANKIVTAGIKKVIFDEPYLMKESVDILNNGGVTTERFQGVKSSAFFKLYQQ